MNELVAIMILIGGFAMLWGFVLQLDKATAFAGNALAKMTGRAQKALSDYRGNTMKRRYQQGIEGKPIFGNATGFQRSLSGLATQSFRRVHLASQPGSSWRGANFEAGVLDLENKKAAEHLKHDENDNAGNDELHEIISDRNPKNAQEAGTMLYELRRRRFEEARNQAARNNAVFDKTWDDAHERKEASKQAIEWEASARGTIGEHSMRIASTMALDRSSTIFSDIATRYQTYRDLTDDEGNVIRDAAGNPIREGLADGYRTKAGEHAHFARLHRITGKMISEGLMTSVQTTKAKKANTQRTEVSMNSFAQTMLQGTRSAERIAELRSYGLTDDDLEQLTDRDLIADPVNGIEGSPELVAKIKRSPAFIAKARAAGIATDEDMDKAIKKLEIISAEEREKWLDNSTEYSLASQRGQRGETVDIQSTRLSKRLAQEVARVAKNDGFKKAKEAKGAAAKARTDAQAVLAEATDYEARVFSNPAATDDEKLAAQQRTRDAKINADKTILREQQAQENLDRAQDKVIRQMAMGSAIQASLMYWNPDAGRRFAETYMSQPMPGADAGVTIGSYQEELRRTSKVFADYERTYRSEAMAATASTAAGAAGVGPGGKPL